ncbi:CBO0543 family protein [Paenibacillus sp. MABNR03]|uniref:CBO0543 family protein n=1 Tax=Paenibacillus sp. MABNR03 TaxID=3142626 RepID=UPI003D28A9F5
MMTLNILVGFVVPWVLFIYLFIKHRRLLFPFFPVAVALASVVNNIGFNYFWLLSPVFKNIAFSAIPFDLGMFPIVALFMLYLVYEKKIKPVPVIFISALILTCLEWLLKHQGRVTYFNNWNVFWTFFSYLIPIIAMYVYSVLFFKIYKKIN